MILKLIPTDEQKIAYLIDSGALSKDDTGEFTILDDDLADNQEVHQLLTRIKKKD